ncbi:hypothetical protein IKW72_06485 [bacterium]|nr:hypothetical protein [bacterium]
MSELKHTESGIYYLYDYIPKSYFEYHTEKEIKVTEKTWDYKDGKEPAVFDFTYELMAAISEMSKNISDTKIALLAVPPSKVGKISTIGTSIQIISEWYKTKITSELFMCNKEIINCGCLLTRSSDISTAHLSRRPDYAENKNAIEFNKSVLPEDGVSFFILDDITTKGTSMDVCQDILVEHGVQKGKIYRLAIAKTILEINR